MRKMFVGGLAVLLLSAGAGTVALAANAESTSNFGQMQPVMQEMHPDLTTDQLNEMYKSCHGTSGANQSSNFKSMGSNMMNL